MTDDSVTIFISFICKSLKRSIECVRHLSLSAQVFALQEHSLRENDISELGNINRDFGFFGKPAMDTSKGILRGRPYGGVALLWDNNRFDRASVIPCLWICQKTY
ncbi:unnamed protein product [Leptidea sinapis]|uniref:Uncharacterized protein n=1 Tax=Leptidea sinapis TaxID=189913 RepID=A0A5E4QI78_9NEOP|nr:unnamed protein product [Leptidea sinapis]